MSGSCVMSPGVWLATLAAGVRNPPSEENFQYREAAIRTACEDLPEAAWNDRSLRTAMRTFAFWPAAADVYALLQAEVRALKLDEIRSRVAIEGLSDEQVRAVAECQAWLARTADPAWVMRVIEENYEETVAAAVRASFTGRRMVQSDRSVAAIAAIPASLAARLRAPDAGARGARSTR